MKLEASMEALNTEEVSEWFGEFQMPYNKKIPSVLNWGFLVTGFILAINNNDFVL
jgi:hypothetical protein